MSDKPVSIKKAREFLARKKKREATEAGELFSQARRDFEAIKKMIIDHYRPRRIYQWGSLLDQSKFKKYSDIDIAVEGVDDPERFFRMFGDAERLTDFPLDLLDINKVSPEFADIIKSRGVLVYEDGNQRVNR